MARPLRAKAEGQVLRSNISKIIMRVALKGSLSSIKKLALLFSIEHPPTQFHPLRRTGSAESLPTANN